MNDGTTAGALVARLQEEWDWPDPALVREIAGQGEAAVAPLAALLTPEVIARSATEDRENALLYYVLNLLGETRSADAVAPLISLFHLADEDLIESLPDALLRLGRPEAVGPLLSVVADESLGWYPRACAGEAAVHLAGADPARRAQIAEAVRPLLAARVRRAAPLSVTPQAQTYRDRDRLRPLNEDDSDIVAELVGTLADVNDVEARPLIESAFRSGLVNTKLTDLDHVNETYAAGGETFFRTPDDWPARYEKDYQEHLREDAGAAGESDAARRLREIEASDWEEVEEPVVLGKRLGRNDPCWCGSGRKYKKCHLAEDEKDGRDGRE